VFLGAKLKETKPPNGAMAWGMSPSKCVQEAVAQLELKLAKDQQHPPKKVRSPQPSGHLAELDESPVLLPQRAKDFQSVIGVLHWCVEIG